MRELSCRGALSVFVLGVLLSGEAQAESRYLDELVVTGTRSERTLLESPVRTEVVTAEEIRKTHARNLKEALMNVPGVLLREIHGKSGYEVWLQGMDANQTLVLIDGKPLNATTGSSIDVSQLSVLEIDRIEVVKGAVSAQYGSSGMGGVINVITRPVGAGWKLGMSADAGSLGSDNPSGKESEPSRYTASAVAETGNDTWGLRVAADQRHTDGVDPEPETWPRPGNEIDRSDVVARLQWTPVSGHRLVLEGQVFSEESSSRFLSTGRRHGKDEDVSRSRVSLEGDHRLGADLDAGWFLIHDDLGDDTIKYTASARYDDRQADMGMTQLSGELGGQLGVSHRLQGGVDLRRDTLDQVKDGVSELFEPDAERESIELWGQDTWMPSDRIEVVTGIRGQEDSDFGSHVAPKINSRFGFGDSDTLESYIRAGVGAGYRVPNLKERFYEFDHSELGYVVKGDPELDPETSISYQLGFGLHHQKRIWFEANGFFNDIENLIDTQLDGAATAQRGDGVVVYDYGNVNRARTWGLETTAGWDIAPGWRVTAGYTWTRSENRETGLDLNRRPEHQANLALDGGTGLAGLSWSLRLRTQSAEYVDAALDMETPGYTTADLKLNYLPNDWLRIYGGVDNLTDSQRDFTNAGEDFRPVEGRYAYLGIGVSFEGP